MPRLSKREAILQVAGDLFVAQGFSRVSIDQIAAAVPISKPTLYAHFKDKRDLYQAVISSRCAKLVGQMQATVVSGNYSVEKTLTVIGVQFLEAVLSPAAINMHRTLTAEVDSFPESGKLFYNSGPKQTHAFLSTYLADMAKQKRLTVADPGLSADMFLSMIRGYAHLQCLLGVRKPLSKKEMGARVAYAVSLFMRAHKPA